MGGGGGEQCVQLSVGPVSAVEQNQRQTRTDCK